MSLPLPTTSITPRRASKIEVAHDLSLSDLSLWTGLSRNTLYRHLYDATDPLPYYQIGPRKIYVAKTEYLAWRSRRFASTRPDPAIIAPRRRRRKSRAA